MFEKHKKLLSEGPMEFNDIEGPQMIEHFENQGWKSQNKGKYPTEYFTRHKGKEFEELWVSTKEIKYSRTIKQSRSFDWRIKI